MKRLAMFAAAALFLTGCAAEPSIHEKEPSDITPAMLEDLYLDVVEGTVTPTGMNYNIVNRSKETWLYGRDYHLQMEDEGLWYNVELTGGVEINEFPADALRTMSASENGEFVDWEGYYGELPDGHYRLVKNGWFEDADGNRSEKIWLAAEFVLPDQPDPAAGTLYVEIVEDSITTTGLTYRFVNESENILEYGYNYDLYEKDGDDWKSVKRIVDSWELNLESELLRRGEVTLEINWEDMYGELPPGEYLLHNSEILRGPDRRVIKERFNLNVEFTIPG